MIPTKLPSLNKIENLVFQGGGVRGIAYLGSLQALCDKDNLKAGLPHLDLSKVKKVGGASAGAITALFLALGNTLEELKVYLDERPFKDLLDEDKPSEPSAWTNKTTALKAIEIFNANINDQVGKSITNFELFIFHIYQCLKVLAGIHNVDIEPLGRNKEELHNKIKKIPSAREYIEAAIDFASSSVKWGINITREQVGKSIEWVVDWLVNLILNDQVERIKIALLNHFFEDNENNLNKYFNAFFNIIKLITVDLGIFSGDKLLKEFQHEIAKVTGDGNLTFREFHKRKSAWKNTKDLYVVALNLSTGITNVFSHVHTPNVVIAHAVRASMSIPYFFKPHIVQVKYENSNLYSYQAKHINERNENIKYTPLFVDGGILDNYPTWLFDRTRHQHSFFFKKHYPIYNQATLGFRLVEKENKEFFEIGSKNRCRISDENVGIFSFSTALGKAIINKQDSDHYHNGDRERTIYIDTKEINTVQFDLSKQQKELLVTSGREATTAYLWRLTKQAKKNYPYTINKSIKYSVLTGGVASCSSALFLGGANSAFSADTSEEKLLLTVGSSILVGASATVGSLISSTAVNSKILGTSCKNKAKRRIKRVLGTGLSATLILGMFSAYSSKEPGKKIDWGVSITLGLISGLISAGSSMVVEKICPPRFKQL